MMALGVADVVFNVVLGAQQWLRAPFLPAILAADTAAGTGTDWRYWYLGALTPAIGALAFRYRSGIGLVSTALAVVVVLGVDGAAGRGLPGPLIGPAPVLFGTAVAGYVLRIGLDRAWSLVADVASAKYLLRMRIAAEQERAREAARRVRTLSGVIGPALQRICDSTPLTVPDAADLLLLEGTVRDQFASPSLVDP